MANGLANLTYWKPKCTFCGWQARKLFSSLSEAKAAVRDHFQSSQHLRAQAIRHGKEDK